MENGLYDRDIREPLYLFLEEKYGKIRIIEEKITGRARADAVMVTESALCGIEIKSDADTYARLPGQVREYDKYFDFNFAVVGLTHVNHIEEHLPSYWGIITAERIENGLDFYVMRRPSRNPHREMARKVSLLWRPEMESILVRTHRPSFRGYSKARVISRSVAVDKSSQTFYPRVEGNAECFGHVACDTIIMGEAKARSIPAITCNDVDASLVHEAAIGRIAGDQILKLLTLGLTEEEAEEKILEGFLN